MNKSVLVFLLAMIVVEARAFAAQGAKRADKDDQTQQTSGDSKPKSKKSFTKSGAWQFKPSIELGYSDNIFMTPTGTYEDPETGVPVKNDPTGAGFLELRPIIKYEFFNKKKTSLEFENDLKAKIFLGGKNASNANGFDNTTSLLWEKKVYNSKSGPIHTFDLEAFYDVHQFSYLHRGTGKKRVTSVAQTDEENRYTYQGPGASAEYGVKTSNDIKASVGLSFAKRDYKEVTGLKSYDRDIMSYGLDVAKKFSKIYTLSAGYEFAKIDYTKNNALNLSGTSVVGTDREYQDTETFLKFSVKPKRQDYSIKYTMKEREDMYVNYYGYEQSKIALKAEFEYRKDRHVGLGYSKMKRDYAHETNPDGVVRDREVNDFDLEWGMEKRQTKWTAKIERKDQDDTDPYYKFKRNVISVEWQKEF